VAVDFLPQRRPGKNEVMQPIVEQLGNQDIEFWALTSLRCRRPRRQSLMKRRR
jgi:hypothetical protein